MSSPYSDRSGILVDTADGARHGGAAPGVDADIAPNGDRGASWRAAGAEEGADRNMLRTTMAPFDFDVRY